MSGIEVVSLVLGAFPLLISALEHYEQTKKVGVTWWKIKRAHKKDFGRVKDCQLRFRLNLKELLIPLLIDGVVQRGEYEALIANPGGNGWREEHVEDALNDRLAECRERYIEIVEEMVDTMCKLSKECRVEDVEFQEALKRRSEKTTQATTNQQAEVDLMIRANIAFEAKRIKYSLTGGKRDDLLAEIERCNAHLQDILASNDRVSTLSQASRFPATRRVNGKILNFWRHASSIFSLLDKVWRCNCRSKASLWLQHHSTNEVKMKLLLKLCHGKQAVRVNLTDTPPTLQIGGYRTARFHDLTPTIASNQGRSSDVGQICSPRSAMTKFPSASTIPVQPTNSNTVAATSGSLESDGICQRCFNMHTSQAPESCVGRVSNGEHIYAFYTTVEPLNLVGNATLADLLEPQSLLKLTRVQRYGIALTLASSHLQLHSTPWLKEQWTSQDVCFPTSTINNVDKVLHDAPYILTQFDSSTTGGRMKKDRSFATLGIVLLELCFGSRLEDHCLWSNPAFAVGKADPMIRQTVACEWLEDVQEEAGEDYATAVNWILRQAPAIVKDDKWRADFAQSVVQRLQRYYEYLNPDKTAL